jgi:hypothetical protein
LTNIILIPTGAFSGSPSYSPPSSPSCDDIKSIIDRLSADIRKLLKVKILTQPRSLNIEGMSGGNLLINIVSNILSNVHVLNADEVLLHALISPTIVFPKSEFGFDVESSWGCLIHIFESD